jgi:hypothetical protein
VPKDPESLGNGIGTLLADFVPLLPSGARRAGAAKVMAARVGHDPSFLVDHPIKAQLLALGLGGAGSALLEGQSGKARAAAAFGPIALVQLLRHRELRKIQRKYDKEKRKRLADIDHEELFDNGALGWGGSSRLGAVNAYETMRARKYKGFGSLAEAGDAIQLAAGAVNPALYTGAIPFISSIDNREADRMLKRADESSELIPSLAKSVPLGALVGALGTSAVLGTASLATRGRSPALAKLLSGAAKDGITVFDPRKLLRLVRSTPAAAKLFDKEMALLRAAEKHGGGGKMSPKDLLPFGGAAGMKQNQADLKLFQQKFNASPSDVMQEAVGGISGIASAGAGAGITGLTGLQEHLAAPREKRFLFKAADFSDQNNSPSLPLYLAAAALSSAGMGAAYRWAHRENTNTPALGTNKWADMVQDMGGGNPLLLSTEGAGNAFFYKPRSPQEAEQFLRETGHLSQAPMGMITATNNANRKRLERFGAIIADSTAGAPTIAHEAGHAKIEETPGILRALQRHLYPHARWMAPLAGAGSMAAGLASGGAGKGALLGTGIGALAGIGMLGPETGASYYALKHLKGLGDGSLSAEGRKDLISALSTYLAATVLPSTLSGAAGGWISGRRKKREEEEEEQEKFAVQRHPALPDLLQAKAHSDEKDYRQKSLLLRQMMDEKPDDWLVDSDDGKGIVGVTHVPTGFKLHVKRSVVSPAVTQQKFAAMADNPYQDPLFLGGVAAAGAAGKLTYDLGDLHKRLGKWEDQTAALARTLTPEALRGLSETEQLNRAQAASDIYTKGGQRVAQKRLLGILPVGQVPKARVAIDYVKARHGLGGGADPDAVKQLREVIRSRMEHYNLFSDPKLRVRGLRGHMLHKALEGSTPGETQRLPKAVQEILFHGDDHVVSRLNKLNQMPVGTWKGMDAAGHAKELGNLSKWVQSALVGNPNVQGPGSLGEVHRLIGAGSQAMSTPQVYREATNGVMRALRGGRTGLAAAGAGLLGVYGLDKLRHQKEASTGDTSRELGAAGLLGVSPLALFEGIRDLRDKSVNNIGVTYGYQDYPGAHIGGGHKEPAVALRDLLIEENARRAKKGETPFNIQEFVRNKDGVLGRHIGDPKSPSFIPIRGERRVNTMVNTGFGNYIPGASAHDRVFSNEGMLHSTPINGRVKTRSLFNYLTDAVPDDWRAFGATPLDGSNSSRNFMLGWGDNFDKRRLDVENVRGKNRAARWLHSKGHDRMATGVNRISAGIGRAAHELGLPTSYMRPLSSGSSVPYALSTEKLNMLKELREAGGAEKAMQAMLTDPGVDDQAKATMQTILDHKAKGGKVVTVSGATRGDYVSIRAKELAEELKRRGRGDVKILAQMANGMQRPDELKLLAGLDNVHTIGRMPQKAFIGSQYASDLHLNSTGTSSWVESLLGRPNNVQPKDWGYYVHYPDHTPQFIDDAKGYTGKPSIAKRLQTALQKVNPGVDPLLGQAGVSGWNRGQLQHQTNSGRMVADSADDILKLLDSGAKNPDVAGKFDKEIRNAHKLFTNNIFREANRNRILTRLKGGGKVGAGLAAIPAALALLGGRSQEAQEA